MKPLWNLTIPCETIVEPQKASQNQHGTFEPSWNLTKPCGTMMKPSWNLTIPHGFSAKPAWNLTIHHETSKILTELAQNHSGTITEPHEGFW